MNGIESKFWSDDDPQIREDQACVGCGDPRLVSNLRCESCEAEYQDSLCMGCHNVNPRWPNERLCTECQSEFDNDMAELARERKWDVLMSEMASMTKLMLGKK